jgi:hypothetical protein
MEYLLEGKAAYDSLSSRTDYKIRTHYHPNEVVHSLQNSLTASGIANVYVLPRTLTVKANETYKNRRYRPNGKNICPLFKYGFKSSKGYGPCSLFRNVIVVIILN